MLLAAVQLFYWPVIVVVFLQARAWTPFAMALLFGSHFLPYAWLYRSRGYALLAIATALALTAAAIATRSALYSAAPLIAAAGYSVAVVMIGREVAVLTRGNAQLA
jgi:hypothetical protein